MNNEFNQSVGGGAYPLIKARWAFTLAEVLITLGIIGIVAALTLPQIISNYQKQTAANSLKTFYSKLNQAFMLYEAKNNISIQDINTGLSENEFLEKYIAPNFKIIKHCSDRLDCYASTDNFVRVLDRKTQAYFYPKTVVLADGMFLGIRKMGENTYMFNIDINGAKKPNLTGRDVFYFFFTSNYSSIDKDIKRGLYAGNFSGLYYPYIYYSREQLLGISSGHERPCSKNNSSTTSDACASVIMLDGWKISDDYPW